MPAQQHGIKLRQHVSRYISMEITSPVVEAEEVVFQIVLLLLAFPLDYIYIDPDSSYAKGTRSESLLRGLVSI